MRDRPAAKPRPPRGLSLERLLPARRNTAPAPPAAPPVPPRRVRRPDRPPLRRSIRLDDAESATEERRRVFVHGPRHSSFDEGDAFDDEDDTSDCECGQSSLERSRGPSCDAPDDGHPDEPELVNPPEEVRPRRARSRGASSDRALEGSPACRAPARALSQGIFERRLPKMYKFGLMDKCKRASSSALYERTDRSPTEAFYNATGSTRLSSQELFEKFCSEEFTSLYGRDDERRRRAPHSKSTGSSGSDVRRERACCRRAAPCGSQPSLGARRHVCLSRTPHSDRSTESEGPVSPRAARRSAAASLRPLPLEYSDDRDDDVDAISENDHSRSAPLLSPDRFEARFTFDISERSEAPSCRDDTPSDATETRNLTLYEEPHSDRTSLCEFYDVAFSSHRPSLRRDSARKRGPFDLSALDFRAIDDESPRISRRASQRSGDDTLRQNSESRSWASDSVFTTPERRAREMSPLSQDTRRSAAGCGESVRTESGAAESTAPDTTIVEDEPPSVIERSEYALALKLGRIDLSDSEEYVPTPLSPIAHEAAKMSSRLSMHRLEPLELEAGGVTNGDVEDPPEVRPVTAGSLRRMRRGASEPRRSSRCFPL